MASYSKRQFFSDLYLFIDRKSSELKGKAGYLTYSEFKELTSKVRLKFRKLCGKVPTEIEIACQLSEAIISPSKAETLRLIKGAAFLAGGGGGIALMIAGVGAALGWGAGVVSTVVAFFVGVNMAPIIGQIVGGAALAGVAAYFFVHQDSPESVTVKSINALKNQIMKVEDQIWEQMKSQEIEEDFWFGGNADL